MTTRIIEQCEVSPSAGAPAEQSLKLLHFDILFLSRPPMRIATFYELFQCSESHFLDTIVPSLKTSLSLCLKHFAPLAGNILVPRNKNSDNRTPVSRFVAGEDSVPLSVAISDANFECLTGNHPMEIKELRDLVPHRLRPPVSSPDSSTVTYSVASFQVTLFPNKGVCIGLIGHHSICDAVSLLDFFRAWASINRSGSLDLSECLLPSYDRDAVPGGDRLAVVFWDAVKAFPSATPSLPSPGDVRATFVLTEAIIKALKRRAFRDGVVGVSSFVVAFAHVWTCLARSATAAGEEVRDEEPEYISCAGDCPGRLSPPLPDTYFGNCLTFSIAESTHGKLKGIDGFSSAAEAIHEAIESTVGGNGNEIVEGSVKKLLGRLRLVGKRVLMVIGSPRLDFYGTDYGWGRPVKVEGYVDYNRDAVFVTKSRDCEGGMEITVLMTEAKMGAFAGFFCGTEKLWCKM